VFQVDVAWCHIPVRLICIHLGVAQPVPFGLCGQTQGFTGHMTLPIAKGLGLQKVDLHRPVPGHVDFLNHTSEPIDVLASDTPESGVLGLLVLPPLPAFVGPPFFCVVPLVLDKAQILPVACQHLAGVKSFHLFFSLSKLIVPAVQGMVSGLTQLD